MHGLNTSLIALNSWTPVQTHVVYFHNALFVSVALLGRILAYLGIGATMYFISATGSALVCDYLIGSFKDPGKITGTASPLPPPSKRVLAEDLPVCGIAIPRASCRSFSRPRQLSVL